MTAPLTLDSRTGLPDALRVLLAEYPKQNWDQDPRFEGLLRFWLDRHLMFRKILKTMRDDTEKLLNKDLSAKFYAAHLSRYGGMFVQGLHEHHSIEDHHYFPKLIDLDARISQGFDILDADHHAIDDHLNRFVSGANAVLEYRDDATIMAPKADKLLMQLGNLERLLNRHLTDEEELVVPVVLKYGAPDI